MLSSSTQVTASNDREAQTLAFFDGMGPDLATFRQTYSDMLAPDVVWETVGRPPRVGLPACLDYLDTLHAGTGMEYCDVELISMASTRDLVFTERIDAMKRADGSLFMDFRIVGITEFRGAKIVRYTDYCDLSALS